MAKGRIWSFDFNVDRSIYPHISLVQTKLYLGVRGMPRNNKNARAVTKPKKMKLKIGPIIIPVSRKQDDKISPGRLVAIAEWRG